MNENVETTGQKDEEEMVPAGRIDLTDEALNSDIVGGAPPTSCQIGSCKAWG
ncbi:MAG: hypothetical protein JWM53_2148 [bacterium]|nr:hypothetical protein [bacterium]